MKKLLPLLLLPLLAKADPHFGPGFGEALLLLAFLCFVGLPLVVAWIVWQLLQRILHNSIWLAAVSLAAVLADWLWVYLAFTGSIHLDGYGVFGVNSILKLIGVAAIGAILAALLFRKPVSDSNNPGI